MSVEIAREKSLAGKHGAALRIFKKLLAASGEHDPVLYAEAGFACDRSGREAQAVALYQLALEGDLPEPVKIDVYFCLASSYRSIGKMARAHKTVRQALRLFPDEPLFLIMSAILAFEGGMPQTSVACLLQLVATQVQRPSLDPYRWFFERESRKIKRRYGKARLF